MSGENGWNRSGEEERRRVSTGTADPALERSPARETNGDRVSGCAGRFFREKRKEKRAGAARAATALGLATFAGGKEGDFGGGGQCCARGSSVEIGKWIGGLARCLRCLNRGRERGRR